MAEFVEAARDMLDTLERYAKYPHGPKVSEVRLKQVGGACMRLGGDNDRARTLWKEIVHELGYMPHAAAIALIWAARARDLMPDVEAPEVG